MMKPTIHTNGTSKDELYNQVINAGHAIQEAIEAMGKASPNGRDYYPQGPDAIKTAVAEHTFRVAKLQEVWRDLYELAEYISDAGEWPYAKSEQRGK